MLMIASPCNEIDEALFWYREAIQAKASDPDASEDVKVVYDVQIADAERNLRHILGGQASPSPCPPQADTKELRLTLPWAVLVPDNARAGVLGGRILLSRRYRDAKTAAHRVALFQLRDNHWSEWWPALSDMSVALTVTLHAPDRRRRDLTNFCKLIHDALTGAAYADDAQLADVRYVRGSIDKANPRAELTLTLLTSLPQES